jgi:hypothetical protein
MAHQALTSADLGPDLIREMVIHGRGAPRERPGRFVVAANGGGRSKAGTQSKDEKANIRGHKILVPREAVPTTRVGKEGRELGKMPLYRKEGHFRIR